MIGRVVQFFRRRRIAKAHPRAIRLMVEGQQEMPFYQTLLIAANNAEQARRAAIAYLKSEGATVRRFDEDQTAELQTGRTRFWFLANPSPEGVIGRTGRVYFSNGCGDVH